MEKVREEENHIKLKRKMDIWSERGKERERKRERERES